MAATVRNIDVEKSIICYLHKTFKISLFFSARKRKREKKEKYVTLHFKQSLNLVAGYLQRL